MRIRSITWCSGLKYHGAFARSRAERAVRTQLQARDEPLPDFMLPVPLAPRRYRERGYNQAIELALAFEAPRHPMRSDIVIRAARNYANRRRWTKARRQEHARRVHAVAPLRALHVAIIDDVVTTGSTVNELARVLRQAERSMDRACGRSREQVS